MPDQNQLLQLLFMWFYSRNRYTTEDLLHEKIISNKLKLKTQRAQKSMHTMGYNVLWQTFLFLNLI